MKIYRIAQEFQMVSQNPGAPNDINVQIQNLNQAREALTYMSHITDLSEQARAAIFNLEQEMGLTNGEMSNAFTEMVKQAIGQSEAFNMLAQMNFVSSVDNLLNKNQLNSIQTIINNDLKSTQTTVGMQNAKDQMGY